MPIIQTNKGILYYAKNAHFETAKPPLILIHGAGSSHLDWPPELRRMKNYNVLALDLPGHGRSDEQGRTRIEDYAVAVLAFMDAFTLDRAVLVGHSMGGAI